MGLLGADGTNKNISVELKEVTKKWCTASFSTGSHSENYRNKTKPGEEILCSQSTPSQCTELLIHVTFYCRFAISKLPLLTPTLLYAGEINLRDKIEASTYLQWRV